jgi:hypothetical protein
MQSEPDELWRKLCAQAEGEVNLEKLLELTKEINRLLDEKEGQRNRGGNGLLGSGKHN